MISRNGPLNLYEKVRLSIAPDIVAPLIENNYLKVLRLNQKLSEYLLENGNEIINYYVCEKELIESSSREYNEKIEKLNTTSVVICASSIRHIVKAFFNNNCHIKNVTVISDTEVASTIEHFGNMILEIISDLGENTIIPEKKLTEEKPAPTNEKDAYAILQKQLETILHKLPEQKRDVISMRFGLDGNGSHTLNEICSYFNITRDEIRSIEVKALQLLRKNH